MHGNDTFVLRTCQSPPRSDPNPDPPLIAHRWCISRPNRHDGQRRTFENSTFHRQCRGRHGPAIRFHIGKGLQQFVGNLDVGNAAVVIGSDKHDTWLTVVGQVIGEGTHGLPGLLGGISRPRSLALATIGFQVVKQVGQFFITQSIHGATFR